MKALIIDKNYYERDFSASTAPWSGEYWKERLKQIISLDDRQSIDHFIETTAKTAFTELQAEFAENGTEAKINTYENPTRIEIEIQYDLVNNFVYGVRNQSRTVSAYLLNEDNLPDAEDNQAHFPRSYFGDAREGYDVRLFTKTN